VYKAIDIDVLSDQTLTIAGSIGFVFNGVSRIGWAALQDKWGFKKVYRILLTFQLIAAFSIMHIRKSAPLFIIWTCVIFTCEGGHFSMFPTVCVKVFGVQKGG
jgi:OFA family oxalate/formate antiporter-like MFS transporter